MTDTVDAVLPPAILAMVSLAANIAANHPKKGLCQLERLRSLGVPEAQIDIVVDIARHLRDEAGQMSTANSTLPLRLLRRPQWLPLRQVVLAACLPQKGMPVADCD